MSKAIPLFLLKEIPKSLTSLLRLSLHSTFTNLKTQTQIRNCSLCVTSWIPTCAKLFIDHQECWQHLVPPNETDSTELVEEFFSCVAALMSIQLRSMVINSLADFLAFFQIHEVCAVLVYVYLLMSWVAEDSDNFDILKSKQKHTEKEKVRLKLWCNVKENSPESDIYFLGKNNVDNELSHLFLLYDNIMFYLLVSVKSYSKPRSALLCIFTPVHTHCYERKISTF